MTSDEATANTAAPAGEEAVMTSTAVTASMGTMASVEPVSQAAGVSRSMAEALEGSEASAMT